MRDASCPKGKKMGAEKKINRCLAIWKIPINKFLGNRNFEFGGVSMIEICSNCGNHAWDKEIIGN